ncbi:threonine/homoserine/homoserine lactone efflux protein [Mesonia hippocampi]|uniref:Threonine/homoserine/homoserine lactone efflux protein n=1 Tax=Mesonia hippocampi TaxID=1628250 RepID=A0A840EWJ7_9FLAO|nr:LysE family transporter [Mesonia hippocampi]MBB4118444.1 threonine/homoserine/homoserine lactone efflux protein [Mesonia hippocampi]
MFQDIVAGIPLGILLAFLLGPVFFLLLETAALKGIRAAIFFDIGVIFADIVFLLIAYFSTSKLLNRIKDEPALFIFGGSILVVYGFITFIKQKKEVPHTDLKEFKKLKKSDVFGLIVKGFLLNFVNIGVLGFWLGLIIAFGPAMDMNPQRLLVFFTSIIITYFLIDMLKIILAKRLNHKLTPTRIYKLKRSISVVIIVCGLIMMSKGIFPTGIDKFEHSVEQIIPLDSLD